MDPTTLADGAARLGPAADFSMVALFLRADPVVKTVMAVLALASIWSWAVIIEKGFRLARLKRDADRFEDLFWSGKQLEEVYQDVSARPHHPMATMFISAMREWRRSTEVKDGSGGLLGGLKDRIEKVLSVTLSRELSGVERHLGYLATIGTTAPFIGLFGTVWGIMNAFQDIATQRDTNLAVVAPGIAEALFATALGLFCAIPAYFFYNNLAHGMQRYATRLEGFADEFAAIVSRQIDQRRG